MADTERYSPHEFETRWAARWVEDGVFTAEDPGASAKPKWYSLDMFPYPSGDLHMGHLEAYSGGDVIARYKWMRGFNVLHPIGWDAFGLNAENAAIQRGINPRTWTYANIEQQADSFKRLGFSFDWTRRFNTCDPDIYRWTQWLFLKFHEFGVVYRKTAAVNWCPKDKTVLANEQVVGGLCERCDTPVTKREVPAWFFRESDYAQRLLDDMSLLPGWTDRILTVQRNWIGRSEGADVTFTIAETGEKITVFTTRPDTLWGVTFFVLAAEHPMAERLMPRSHHADYEAMLQRVRNKTEIERTAMGRARDGLFTGAHAINPVNGDRIPIWVADYVLMEYGTGAIMAVPAHDQRDFEFARQHKLPVRVVIRPEGAQLDGATMAEAYDGEGAMVNSGDFDGTATPGGIPKVVAWLEEHGLGKGVVRFRLRDWNVSRQRFWGCPIPMIHCARCGDVRVPEEDLPVILPDLDDYTPTGTGESPLAKVADFVNVKCPSCGADAQRETETLDTFIDSSWYFFRYCSPANDAAAFDPEQVAAWMPVDQYMGGITHATGHLIYSRFFTKVLHDMGMVGFVEPYPALVNQGDVIMEGSKMSKSRGNLVQPKEIYGEFGADTARVTMLFANPFEADVDWADVSPQGVFKWLSRVWRLAIENLDRIKDAGMPSGDSALRKATHRAIAGVTTDIERFRFNTAIAKLMTLYNDITAAHDATDPDVAEAVDALLRMLQPFAPFIVAELWSRLGRNEHATKAAWPTLDETLVRIETVTMVVQVNGKVRDRIDVPSGITDDEMIAQARRLSKVAPLLEGATIRKAVAVPPKLVNFVVG